MAKAPPNRKTAVLRNDDSISDYLDKHIGSYTLMHLHLIGQRYVVIVLKPDFESTNNEGSNILGWFILQKIDNSYLSIYAWLRSYDAVCGAACAALRKRP